MVGARLPWWLSGNDSTCNAGDAGQSLSWEYSRVTTGNSGCLLCRPREVQSSVRVAKESWGLLSSDCRANGHVAVHGVARNQIRLRDVTTTTN